jgi:hypothetical protein
MILDPEYGRDILGRFSSNITMYDYTNKTREQNPLGHKGISLIIWDGGQYHYSINYQEDGVLFKIEDDFYKYINNKIYYEHLTKAHYEYYSDYITYLKSHAKNVADMSSGFKQQLPNNYVRDEKLKELI